MLSLLTQVAPNGIGTINFALNARMDGSLMLTKLAFPSVINAKHGLQLDFAHRASKAMT